MMALALLEGSQSAGSLSSCLMLTWLATVTMLPIVTIAGLVCHIMSPRNARKVDAVAIGMAVGVVAFFISFLAVGGFRVLPMETAEAAGLAVVGALSLAIAIPCSVLSAIARTISLKREARRSKVVGTSDFLTLNPGVLVLVTLRGIDSAREAF